MSVDWRRANLRQLAWTAREKLGTGLDIVDLSITTNQTEHIALGFPMKKGDVYSVSKILEFKELLKDIFDKSRYTIEISIKDQVIIYTLEMEE